jgi:hypothetical protein
MESRGTDSQFPVCPWRQRAHSPHEIWKGTLRHLAPHDPQVEVAGRHGNRPHEGLSVAV